MHVFFNSLILVLFSIVSSTDTELQHWGQRLLNASDNFFARPYEQHIFDKFRSKFAPIHLENISIHGETRMLDVSLFNNKIPYKLNAEMNDISQITYVFRELENLLFIGNKHDDSAIRRWLGKFFFRLDSGDSSAMRDMIFYKDIHIRYKEENVKTNVISTLLHDFPQIIQPAKIEIRIMRNRYIVQITNNFLTDLLIEIPESQMIDIHTEDLQRNLYERLLLILNKHLSPEPSKRTDEITDIQKIAAAYPGSKIEMGVISVPYPYQRIKILKEVQYELNPHNSRHLSRLPFPAKLALEYNSTQSTITLNDVLPVTYYLAPGSGPVGMQFIAESVRFLYTLILPVCTDDRIINNFILTGLINYRGYIPQTLKIESTYHWCKFLQALQQEGTLYFYPSIINEDKSTLVIKGLLYVLNGEHASLYHFAELKAQFSKLEHKNIDIDITMYPYLSTMSLSN